MRKLTIISLVLALTLLLTLSSLSAVADEGIPWFGLIPYLLTGGPQSNKAPMANFSAEPTSGEAPLTVEFNASSSVDPDGTIDSYEWEFGDGFSGSGETTTHTYHEGGDYQVNLAVTDDDGKTDYAQQTIDVASKKEQIKDAIDYWNSTTRDYATGCIKADHGGDYNIAQVADVWENTYSSWVYVSDPSDPQEGGFAYTPASETIEMDLRGDCDDFAVLMAASIEAIGGIARVVEAARFDTAHAFAEVLLGPDEESCSELFQYIKDRYNIIGDIWYYEDSQGIWLNLDWQDNHPGGEYFDGERVITVYPRNEPPSSIEKKAIPIPEKGKS